MYPRHRIPIARAAMLVGAISHIAKGQARQSNMEAENAYYRGLNEIARNQSANANKAQMQAQQQAQQAQMQAVATEEAIR